jgi:hypothetical protein
MAYGKGGRIFPGAGVAALTAALLAAACSTSSTEDVALAPGRSGQPADTGTYPNLNIPQHAATSQFTDEERDAKLAQLRARQQVQDPGAAAADPQATRKRLQLLQDEQDETLKVIEGE